MAKRKVPLKRAGGGIDWEAVRLAWGMAVMVGGVGTLIVWGTLTAPPGPGTDLPSRAISVSYKLARMLPTSVTRRIAVALGGLMILFALFTFVMGFLEFFRRRG